MTEPTREKQMIDEAREIALSIHEYASEFWKDAVRKGRRDDGPDMRIALAALRSREAEITALKARVAELEEALSASDAVLRANIAPDHWPGVQEQSRSALASKGGK